MADQYVATDKDNVAVSPQPGDVEITDAFGNVFDNFNEYGVGPGLVAFYDKDNVLKDPQPAYQNLDYVSRDVDNSPSSPPFEPDAAQWVARGVDNQVRTPEPYVKSPLYPSGAPASYVPSTRQPVVMLDGINALLTTEDDVSTIDLIGVSDNPAITEFI